MGHGRRDKRKVRVLMPQVPPCQPALGTGCVPPSKAIVPVEWLF